MRKTALVYGGISGLILVISWHVFFNLLGPDGDNGKQDYGYAESLGFATMLLALSLVFFGIRYYRNKIRGGYLSWKEGFLSGLAIITVTSLIYVGGWMIYHPIFMPDFMDKYTAAQVQKVENSDISEDEKGKKIKSYYEWQEAYRNPAVKAGVTFVEIFPMGLVVVLICATILRKKRPVDLTPNDPVTH